MTVVSRVRPEADPVVAGRPDRPSDWTAWYARSALILDFLSALTGGMLAFFLRFPDSPDSADPYVAASMSLPVVWILALVV